MIFFSKKYIFLMTCVFIFSFSGCAKIDPRKVDIDIPSGIPKIKDTELTNSLKELGKMAEIYGVKTRIMIDKISDNTGTAEPTKGEIPYDVTEITATTLNSIGKNVLFIPYRPDILLNLEKIGYKNFKNKLIPSAIITGGITEFDRGLETREDSVNLGYETDTFGDKIPVGLEYMQGKKESTARITIDYNMIDMETVSGLPGVQTTNTIEVHKGIGKKELGFTLFGPTLGLKGEVKKVEGRHAALRVMIQASIIQLIGKYLDLPYWRLLPGASPDSTVESYVNTRWKYQMDDEAKINKIQEFLFIYGYKDVSMTGFVDHKTKNAMDDFSKKMKCSNRIDFDFYKVLYYNIPLDDSALERRYALLKNIYKAKIAAQQAAEKEDQQAAVLQPADQTAK